MEINYQWCLMILTVFFLPIGTSQNVNLLISCEHTFLRDKSQSFQLSMMYNVTLVNNG